MMKVIEDDLRQSQKGIHVQSYIDFTLIKWRNNRVFKLLTKTQSEFVSHTIEMSTFKTGQLSCLSYMEFSRTHRSGKIVQTQIRLLLGEQSDQGRPPVCYSICII